MKFNIKKIVIGLLGIMLICYGIGAAIFSYDYKNIRLNKSNYNYNTSKTLDVNGIKTIYVDTSDSSMSVASGDETNAKVDVKGIVTTNSYNRPKLNCYKKGDTLYIEFKRKHSFMIGWYNSSQVKMNITIPKIYNNNMEVYSSAGDVSLRNLKLDDLYSKLSAGNLDMGNLNLKSLTCKNSAGRITGDNIICNTSSVDSSAGNIGLTNFSGDIKSRNSAGKTSVQYNKFNNNVDLKNSAGNIYLTLPKESKFNIDASVSAGDINCSFPITVNGTRHENSVIGRVGESNNTIKIRNSAGNVEINN
ncbi:MULTISPECIES: DUF4097 family beta strand repeat-containing protein [Clostridium]|uniref:DUF4097 family beta strand repeat-containing protein n=1 Tax=Clostridium TaxID=1485 RepID=UPI0008248DA0|nr:MULTISPECIES: DUF4097 family beta strand repeat-containing protein [Clostridium]PJI07778.1 DUF4097 domain-containing protein [Clostridium sp. CT7]